MAIAHTEQENRRATMKDVARRAGVTIGTVSHVINGTAPISEETTARVREAIRELNYVPNLAARHMRRKEKHTKEGRGVVIDANLLTGILKIRLHKRPDAAPVSIHRKEVRIVKDAQVRVPREFQEAYRYRPGGRLVSGAGKGKKPSGGIHKEMLQTK